MERETIPIPGGERGLAIERDDHRRIRRVRGGGRDYLVVDDAGGWTIDGGLVAWRSVDTGNGELRRVTTPHGAWTEEYAWDGEDRPTLIDGVTIERDAAGRIVACTSAAGAWRYRHADNRLIGIDTPRGSRWIGRGADGRATAWREGTYACDLVYDGRGRRADQPAPPATWRFDDEGRLWAIVDDDGHVRHLFLWAGLACFARIDGPLGLPVAAAFTLDPTATPVRVVTAAGARRIPRDAYGESLLAEPLVPGLFGGASFGGWFHYRARALDPITGSYGEPDPLDGSADDPRRRAGATGPLLVETGAGLYACCQHDPIGRCDPTGELSLLGAIGKWSWLFLSRFSWSYRLTLLNWIGLRFGLHLYLSLWHRRCGRWMWMWCEYIGSRRTGNWGFMADKAGLAGLFHSFANGEREFTIGETFWTTAEYMDRTRAVSVFVPDAPFAPTHYGSQLHAVPAGKPPAFMLINRERNRASHHWIRTGGEAAALAPGLRDYHFPDGAFHVRIHMEDNDGQPGDVARRGPFAGRLDEVRAAGQIVEGRIVDVEVLEIDGDHDLRHGDKLYVEQGGWGPPASEVLVVDRASKQSDKTVVWPQARAQAVRTGRVVFGRELGRPATTRGGRTVLAGNDAIDVIGLSEYRTQQIVSLVDTGGANRVYTRIEQLRATLDLDTAYAVPGPDVVLHAGSSIKQKGDVEIDRAHPDTVIFPGAAGPQRDDLIGIFDPATPADVLPVRVINVVGNNRIVDRPIPLPPLPVPPPPPPIPKVKRGWSKVTAGKELGAIDSPQPVGLAAPTHLRYQPERSDRAPAKGIVVMVQPQPPAPLGGGPRPPRPPPDARKVTTRVDDAIVPEAPGIAFLQALPAPVGGAALTVTVERFDGTDVSLVTFRNVQTFEAAAPIVDPVTGAPSSLQGDCAEVFQIGGPVLVAGTKAFDGALAADVITINLPSLVALPDPAQVGELISVRSAVAGGPVEARILDELRFTVTLDRAVQAAGPLRALPIAARDPFWYAERLDGVTLIVSDEVDPRGPLNPPPAVQAGWFPRLRAGELVEVTIELPPAVPPPPPFVDIYRVDAVEGTKLTLAAGPPLPVAHVLAAVGGRPAVWVRRVGVVDLGTSPSAPYVMIDVNVAAPQVDGLVWTHDSVRVGQRLAFTDGATTIPAKVVSIDAADARLVPRPGAVVIAGAVEVGVVRAAHASVASVAPNLQRVELDVEFYDGEDLGGATVGAVTLLATGPNATYYVAMARRGNGATAAGSFRPPTVLCPEDPERYEYDRHKALTEHELIHTKQCANRGPFLLSSWKWGWAPFVFQQLGHLDAVGPGEIYSDYRACVIGTTNAVRWVEIANRAELTLDDGTSIQLERDGTVIDARIGASLGNDRFQVRFGGVVLADGPARLRALDTRGWPGWVAQVFGALVNLTTVGGIVSTTQGNLFGVIDLAIREAFNLYDRRPARVPEGRERSLTAVDGGRLGLVKYDALRVFNGDDSCWASVIGVNEVDGSIDIDESITPAAADRSVSFVVLSRGGLPGDLSAGTRLSGDWLTWVMDPWGRLERERWEAAGGTERFFLKLFTLAFGTRSWFDLPYWGYFYEDNGRHNKEGKGYLSRMEQEASSESGDLYSTLGRVRDRPTFVGDIGRYWRTGGDRWGSTLAFGRGERVGHQSEFPARVLLAHQAGGPSGPPNGDRESDPGRPFDGIRLPEAFFDRAQRQPLAPDGNWPRGFELSPAARIPARRGGHHSKTLHLSDGYYVAFSGPTPAGEKDRITVANDRDAFDEAGKAQAAGVQQLFHDLTIKDVVVTCGGVDVPRTAPPAAPPVIELVRTQRARVRVTPNGARRYALMTRLPQSGTLVQVDGDLLLAQGVDGDELVEVSRHYTWLAAEGRHDAPVLNHHGTHLPGDIDVPVRKFLVRVVGTVGFRRQPRHTEPVLAPADRMLPGEVVYLLVPTGVTAIASAAAYVAPVPPGKHADPSVPADELHGAERQHARNFLGADGALYRVRIDPDQPCEQACDVTYTIDVLAGAIRAGVAGAPVPAQLTAVLRLAPHFRLDVVGGGPAAIVAGAGVDLRFTALDGVVLGADAEPVVHGLPGVTAEVIGTELVVRAPAGTAAGVGRVVVRDPAHHDRKAQRAVEVT